MYPQKNAVMAWVNTSASDENPPTSCSNFTADSTDVFMASDAIETSNSIALSIIATEARIDSRLLAKQLGKQPRSIFKLVLSHQTDFEQFGEVRFEIAPSRSGQPEKLAMLNEDQAYLLLTYASNTAEARALKVKLIQVFSDYRRAADMRRTEYLPVYHQLQDAIHTAAAGSTNESRVHSNIAKLLNKTAGIDAGQRATAPVPKQALLIVLQMMAAQIMQSARDHREGYQRVKASMLELSAITMLDVGHD